MLTPNKDNIKKTLDFFRQNPSRWRRGKISDRDGKCCIVGAAVAIKRGIDPIALPRDETSCFLYLEAERFLGINKNDIWRWNDDAKSVEDLVRIFTA